MYLQLKIRLLNQAKMYGNKLNITIFQYLLISGTFSPFGDNFQEKYVQQLLLLYTPCKI